MDITDLLGLLRYGVPTSEKERLAISGSLPGAPKDSSAGQEKAQRFASGYLFGQSHPTMAPLVQPLVNQIKTSGLPFLGGSSPELQSYAQQGMNLGSTSGEESLMDRLLKLFSHSGSRGVTI